MCCSATSYSSGYSSNYSGAAAAAAPTRSSSSTDTHRSYSSTYSRLNEANPSSSSSVTAEKVSQINYRTLHCVCSGCRGQHPEWNEREATAEDNRRNYVLYATRAKCQDLKVRQLEAQLRAARNEAADAHANAGTYRAEAIRHGASCDEAIPDCSHVQEERERERLAREAPLGT